MMERQKLQKEALEILSNCQGYSEFLVSYFEKYLGKNVLEVGSGIGNITCLLNKEGRVVIPSDIDKESLKILKLKFVNAAFLDITLDISKELIGKKEDFKTRRKANSSSSQPPVFVFPI